MDDYALAALFGWDDFRALSGWVGPISLILVLALTHYLGRHFASQEALERECREREEAIEQEARDRREAIEQECRDRKTADEHRDERVHHLSEITQQYIGKIDLLRERMNEQDRLRERETADLREEVRTGFARLEALLERRGNGNRNKGGTS